MDTTQAESRVHASRSSVCLFSSAYFEEYHVVNEKEVKNENKKQQKDKEKKENIPSLSSPSPSPLLFLLFLSPAW